MEIAKLSYHPKWIEYKLLSKELLAEQLIELKKGEDTNTEHYRYRTFKSFIESNPKFTDNQVNQFIELTQIDPDTTMAGSALSEFIQSGKLNSNQYLKAKQAFIEFGEWTKKVIDRIENPDKEAFNKEFCEQLEVEINKQLPLSNHKLISKYWCDGIEHHYFSKKYVNDNKKLSTRMWIGNDGQTEYQTTIEFGKYALRRYARGTDMIDCIPTSNIDAWLEIDTNEKMLKTKLK